MTKVVLGVIVGVFIGAFTMEILRGSQPALLGRVKDKAKRTADEFRLAFAEGYAASGGDEQRSMDTPS